MLLSVSGTPTLVEAMNVLVTGSGVPRGGVGMFKPPPPRNSEDIGGVLDRMSKNWRLNFLLQFTVFSYGVIY